MVRYQMAASGLNKGTYPVSQVGQKLFALQGIKQKEDASHTIAIGKEMFGKIIIGVSCSITNNNNAAPNHVPWVVNLYQVLHTKVIKYE